MKIHIQHGRLIDASQSLDQIADLFIVAGKIVAVGQAPDGFHANQVIDAKDCIVSPGLVDMAARLREPGFEYRATLESELQAAARAGVTSLACPPDTDPVLDEPGLVEMLKHRAKQLNLAHVYPMGALTQKLLGQEITEMCELTEAGCVAFSQANTTITDTQVLWRAMQYAATFGLTVCLRPEEAYLSRQGVAHDGEVAARLGLKAIPSAAETLAIYQLLSIAQQTGAKLHLCRLSTAQGVEMVRQAKRQGQAVSCDVSINHLHLTDMDIGYFDSNAHLQPPLRGQRDRDALRMGLMDGTIDAICSDHTPVDEDSKLYPFAESEAGATGLELLLPLTLKWATENKVSIAKALQCITSQPAKILGIPASQLAPNYDADICIFNPETYWTVSASSLLSQGKNTPFLGYELAGRVTHTLLHGQLVYQASAHR